ncbi:MAG: hypothetical protein JKY93_09895 [Gammaproteobacteria bacterium]|nr:hypothetical protein [Gammaproteobacteria bacterium]
MKQMITAVFISLFLLSTHIYAAEAVEKGAASSVIKKTHTTSGFKGLLNSIWRKLRAVNPRPAPRKGTQVVYTAGIRGAETTTTLFQPYWKDDKTADKAYLAELSSFSAAQKLADADKLAQAGSAFDQFLTSYPDSLLRPNALFAKGMTSAGLSHAKLSKQAFTKFIDENPAHPLVPDAKQIISML